MMLRRSASVLFAAVLSFSALPDARLFFRGLILIPEVIDTLLLKELASLFRTD